MADPIQGVADLVVLPAGPEPPQEADVADPGEVAAIKAEQKKTESGKYGEVKAPSNKRPDPEDEDAVETTWIEIELVDANGEPAAGAHYQIETPDGAVIKGTLDQDGFAHREWIQPGTCKVTFPQFDEDAWEPA